ncbi:hypothetical protein GCM10022409_49230 [Hymenobacter glaciei]|uniref:Uncharacterized protein n=1 Tax=Hymenobacter glaciei TaxID=877209 RepID=A0ABP7V0E4_9BACT
MRLPYFAPLRFLTLLARRLAPGRWCPGTLLLMLCLAGFGASAQVTSAEANGKQLQQQHPEDSASADTHFQQLLGHYHQQPDKRIVPLTINYLNRHTVDSAQIIALQRQCNILAGFLTALLAQDTTLRQQLRELHPRITDPGCRGFVAEILTLTPDQLFAKMPLMPAYNDVAWAAYGATGDTRYLQLVLGNCRYAAERKSLNLYLTGASARWSLCSMAQQDAQVKSYLLAQRNSPEARLVLRSTPAALRQQITEGIARTQQHGGWQP